MFNLFTRQNLRGDVLGGITAAIVSLPLALTFGVASGLGPEAGLYGALLVGLFAAVFGGTPTLISEPTGPMTVLMTAVIASFIASDPENGAAMAFTVVMMAGVFQILFGALKLGKYITLMPYSVVSGFMSGIGCILIIMQLAPALGQASPSGGVIGTLTSLPDIISNISLAEFALFGATLALLFLTPNKITRIVPAQLIALVLITIASLYLIDGSDIRRIGEFSVGLPEIVVPTFTADQWQTMVLEASVLGMLGCIDSMLTSVIADNLTRTEHKSNKELMGQGVGNLMSGLFGGLPGAGATMGTVVNIQAGARTAWSGVTRVVVLGIAIFGAASLISVIPLALLAAIAVKVGVDILDWSFIKRAHRVSWQSTLIMYSVLTLTVLVDLMVAVGIGLFVANIIIIEKLSQTQSRQIKAISDMDDELPLAPAERELLNQGKGNILYFYLSGPMIFGVSKALSRERASIAAHKAVIIDLSDVSLIDDTISLSIENMIVEALESKKEVCVVYQSEANKNKLCTMSAGSLPEDMFVRSRQEALIRANEYLKTTEDETFSA
ncbi:low affinity sulfate transporter [Catenovulum agarivorans DS-2]|uniref:Low affinity sulfate transporter n=1 Tax=Catenovulum agarivorans DS-2 TaxID=1328313 RepID=W7QKH5_9ALTE|nr:SulP family inorganic anion transporter [Catenovulum agarivorans]EWH09462.1 low affinity sulfate transporter [Catenovulum agarivorans DS-2]